MPKSLVDNEFFIDFDTSNFYDSEGNPLTQEQNNFFKDSKCVDEYGSLLVVYRASNSDYDTFDTKLLGSGAGSIFGKGFYFSSEPESVKIYGNLIKKYYLNLKNPFVYDAVDYESDAIHNVNKFISVLKVNNYPISDSLQQQLENEILENDGGLDTLIELTCGEEKATAFLQACGFAGIINLDVLDFVAYSPKQIKLCSNKTPTDAISTAA